MPLPLSALAAAGRALRARAVPWQDRTGSVSLEYAFAAPPFIALLTGVFYVALVNVAQGGLETATESAARLILTGQAQSGAVTNSSGSTDVGMTAADFKNAICNGTTITTPTGTTIRVTKMLPAFLLCGNLLVNVAPATYAQSALALQYNSGGAVQTSYSTSSSGGSGANRIMMVQLIYVWPTFNGLFGLNLANENNGRRRLVATSVFTTESYTCAASQTSC